MKILVTAASRHRATAEIAEAIARVLRRHGHQATVEAPERVPDAGDYDAFVIGSAVYAGHWLEPAKELARRLEPTLAGRPVWLFSSGPVGNPRRSLVRKMGADPVDLPALLAHTHAREHRVLAGRLAAEDLPVAQRLPARLVRLEGDWRDWSDVERWADGIAEALAPAAV